MESMLICPSVYMEKTYSFWFKMASFWVAFLYFPLQNTTESFTSGSFICFLRSLFADCLLGNSSHTFGSKYRYGYNSSYVRVGLYSFLREVFSNLDEHKKQINRKFIIWNNPHNSHWKHSENFHHSHWKPNGNWVLVELSDSFFCQRFHFASILSLQFEAKIPNHHLIYIYLYSITIQYNQSK